jgi:transposase-like protein
VLTDDSHVEMTIPRDREARFDPVLIGKYQRRLPGFDDKVISLYTRGMSTREIQGHLEEIYGAEVSPQLISTVTDEVTAWQSRPLEPLYPVMFCDALRVKVRDQGTVFNKAVYSPWASRRMAASTSWGSGSTRTKAPNSGCGLSMSGATAGPRTFSSPWSTG